MHAVYVSSCLYSYMTSHRLLKWRHLSGILNELKIQQRQKLLMNRLLSIESTSNGMRNKWLMLSRLSQMDHLAIRCAAEEYDVPRSTLGDRISGRVVPGSTSGPPKYLSTQEEEELVQFLIDCASIGYPRSRLEVIAMV